MYSCPAAGPLSFLTKPNTITDSVPTLNLQWGFYWNWGTWTSFECNGTVVKPLFQSVFTLQESLRIHPLQKMLWEWNSSKVRCPSSRLQYFLKKRLFHMHVPTAPLGTLFFHRPSQGYSQYPTGLPVCSQGSTCTPTGHPVHLQGCTLTQTPNQMHPTTWPPIPGSMFVNYVSYNTQHGSACVLARCGVQSSGIFVALWPIDSNCFYYWKQ